EPDLLDRPVPDGSRDPARGEDEDGETAAGAFQPEVDLGPVGRPVVGLQADRLRFPGHHPPLLRDGLAGLRLAFQPPIHATVPACNCAQWLVQSNTCSMM